MTRKPTRRIEFTVPEELGERYDRARGHIPMATWIKAVLADDVAAAEETIEYLTKTGTTAPDPRRSPPYFKKIRPTVPVHHDTHNEPVPASADAKRAVRPIPKGKR